MTIVFNQNYDITGFIVDEDVVTPKQSLLRGENPIYSIELEPERWDLIDSINIEAEGLAGPNQKVHYIDTILLESIIKPRVALIDGTPLTRGDRVVCGARLETLEAGQDIYIRLLLQSIQVAPDEAEETPVYGKATAGCSWDF